MTTKKLKTAIAVVDDEQTLRDIDKMLDAEREFFDRLWYQRKTALLQNVREGREQPIDADTEKRLRAEMTRIEQAYGVEALTSHHGNCYDFGFMSGGIAGLCRVLNHPEVRHTPFDPSFRPRG